MSKQAKTVEKPEEVTPEEEVLLTSVRAKSWSEFYGQETVKSSLLIAIEAAKKRGEALEHVLLYGPPRTWQDNSLSSYRTGDGK